jgi:hypothetical protein
MFPSERPPRVVANSILSCIFTARMRRAEDEKRSTLRQRLDGRRIFHFESSLIGRREDRGFDENAYKDYRREGFQASIHWQGYPRGFTGRSPWVFANRRAFALPRTRIWKRAIV